MTNSGFFDSIGKYEFKAMYTGAKHGVAGSLLLSAWNGSLLTIGSLSALGTLGTIAGACAIGGLITIAPIFLMCRTLESKIPEDNHSSFLIVFGVGRAALAFGSACIAAAILGMAMTQLATATMAASLVLGLMNYCILALNQTRQENQKLVEEDSDYAQLLTI